jgi:hypothetical protein
VPPGFYRDAVPVRWVPPGAPQAVGVYVSASHSSDVIRIYPAGPGTPDIVDVYRLKRAGNRGSPHL